METTVLVSCLTQSWIRVTVENQGEKKMWGDCLAFLQCEYNLFFHSLKPAHFTLSSALRMTQSNWKSTALPRPSMYLNTCKLCHRGTQNLEYKNTGLHQGKFLARKIGGREKGRRLWEGWWEEVCSRGDRWKGSTTGLWTSDLATEGAMKKRAKQDSPNLNQLLSHDNSQLYSTTLDTVCIQTAKINTPSENPIHKNNKASRLQSTKRWD